MPAHKGNHIPDTHDYEQDIKEFGHNLKDARVKAGLSLDDLVRIIDSDKSHLSKVESGSQIPKVDTVFRLMDALSLSASSLMPARFLRSSQNSELDRICELYGRLPEGKRSDMLRYIQALVVGLTILEQESEDCLYNLVL